MESNPTKKGRFHIVDPNDFDGQRIGEEKFVPLEDLCISVELSTKTRARSLIESNGTVTSDGKTATISFIKGKKVGDEEVLTTSYTDLSEVSTNTDIEEALGISSIDITFNSSYAPMVTVNFIDVRGGALFQRGATSDYGVLFKMPYPIFELTIKGYYGKPVKYALHMTKVSSKFNSQSGNFEITCNFIGYTYAMLTDVLFGFLRAVPFLEEGKEYFSMDSKDTSKTVALSELLKQIGKLEQSLFRLPQDSKSISNINVIEKSNENLKTVEKDVTVLKNDLKEKAIGSDDIYVVTPFVESSPFFSPSTGLNGTDGDKERKLFDTYKIQAATDIETYNSALLAADNVRLARSEFVDRILFSKITKRDIVNSTTKAKDLIKTVRQNTDERILITTVLEPLGNWLKLQTGILDDTLINIYDFSIVNKSLVDAKASLGKLDEETNVQLRDELTDRVREQIGFKPSIRNLMSVLTKHIEVFFELLYNVSKKYEDAARMEQFKKYENTKSLDIKAVTPNTNTKLVIYPWPEYNDKGVEKYLGTEGVVPNPMAIPEVKFVEDMYAALIASAKQEEDELTADGNTLISYCINPLEGDLLIDREKIEPYSNVPDASNVSNISEVVLKRALIYLGISNRMLGIEEIQEMARIEATRLAEKFRGENEVSLKAFVEKGKDILNENLPDTSKKILEKVGDLLKYRPENTDGTVINLAGNLENLNTRQLFDYNAKINSPEKKSKQSVMLKVITNEEYQAGSSVTLKEPIPALVDNGISYEGLKSFKIEELDANSRTFKELGFNPFNSIYGMQEFRKVRWPNSDPKYSALEAMYLFYTDAPTDVSDYASLKNGLSLSRKDSGSLKTASDYDAGEDKILALAPTVALRYDRRKIYSPSSTRKMSGENFELSAEYKSDSTKVSYPYINYTVDPGFGSRLRGYSLFGSLLYYGQKSSFAKVFLFLHSLPWRGLAETDTSNDFDHEFGIFTEPTIMNLFAFRAGLIQVPKLWPAFIGGLLYRFDYKKINGKELIDFDGIGPNGKVYFIPESDDDTYYPAANEYLASSGGYGQLSFQSGNNKFYYKKIERGLLDLPVDVKEEFKQAFIRFKDNEWQEIRPLLEIIDVPSTTTNTQDITSWISKYKQSVQEVQVEAGVHYLPTANLTPRYVNLSQLSKFLLAPTGDIGSFLIEYKDGSEVMDKILGLYHTPTWIVNSQWNIWTVYNKLPFSASPLANRINAASAIAPTVYTNFNAKASDMDVYLTTFFETLKADKDLSLDTIKLKVFGSTENDEIKLNLYRTFKAIYDKWIAGVGSPSNIIFQNGKRFPTDGELASKRNASGPELIDSFRFVDKAFRDIGDDFFVNLGIFKRIVTEGGVNESVYSIISKILTDNNFEFVALPSFVNFNDTKEVKAMFTPYSYEDAAQIATGGPSFVCVYVGQVSTKLDFGDDPNREYEHPNDGMDFEKDGGLPDNFTDPQTSYEDSGVAFKVNYGHQNQNIFKDIALDQNEFTETAESLKIIDDLASSKTGNHKSFVGQNLYNVFSIRSYKATIEMLGNAMIQPMMYFQLNNIPMFHGAYLITNVKHNLKPNHMVTTFTGVRVKKNMTPLLTEGELYTNLIESINVEGVSTGEFQPYSYVPKYRETIIGSLPANTVIEGTKIPNVKALVDTAEGELKKWDYGKVPESQGAALIDAYVKKTPGISADGAARDIAGNPWSAVFVSYIMLAGDSNFPNSASHYGYATAALNGQRGYELFPLKAGLKIKPEIGDILVAPRPGKPTASHGEVVYKIENNVAFLANGNYSSTAKARELTLTDGHIVDATPVDKSLIIIKRTEGKYYNGKPFKKKDTGLINKDATLSDNMNAFLFMIRSAEGTAGPNGYRTIFGGKVFPEDFKAHPRVRVPFYNKKERKNDYSTAAGAYQFLFDTWEIFRIKLNLPDFGPKSQNLACVQQLQDLGAVKDIESGNFLSALRKVGKTWASLPYNGYKQNPKSLATVQSFYLQGGGTIA